MTELLTVAEAATVAGVSVRTMRRRVAAGEVMTSGHGQQRRIVAASVTAPTAPSEAANPATGGHEGDSVPPASAAMTEDMTEDNAATRVTAAPELGRLAELVERLSDRLAEQTGLTAMWQERAGTLADRLAVAETKLLALDERLALAAPSESSLTLPGAPDGTDAPREPALTFSWTTNTWRLVAVGLVILAGVVLLLVWRW